MTELRNDTLIRAARREPVARTPVWMMRQAGRYLPEYRAVRSEEEFFTVCRTPDLAAEITLQPVRRFDIDAAIIFSDILVVPQAMGMEVQMVPGRGPVFTRPLQSVDDLKRLRTPDVVQDLGYVFDALRLVRTELDGRVPLIGFCGAPWTLMAYMIEGSGSKTFTRSRSWLYAQPGPAMQLLDLLTGVLIEYLDSQVRAGAQVLQIFDSWAGLLSPAAFRRFSIPFLSRIAGSIKAMHPEVPLIVFARGANECIHDLARIGYDVVGLDWNVSPAEARRQAGDSVALQGNLDPAVLYAPPAVIREQTHRMLAEFGPVGHIANLGHGMNPDHDPDHAHAFVEAVHSFQFEPTLN